MLASILANWILGEAASMTWLGIPRLDEVRFDGGGLLFLLGVSILATVLFSIVPLVSALRAPTQLTLRAAGRSGLLSRGQARLRDTFMIAQTAFAVIVTTEMVAMARSLAEIQRLPLGYRPDSVFIARISLPAATYQSSGDLARFEERLHRELTADPMVVSAGAVSVAPLTGLLRAVPFRIVGRPAPDDRDVPVAHFRSISPDYLTTVGAALRTGRLLSSTDDENSVRVALVSQVLADQYLGPNPVGQQLMVNDNNEGPRPLTVVGVVRNMRHVDLEGPPTFDIFVPLAQVHRDDAVFVAASQFWAVRLRSARADFREAFVRVLMRTDRNVALSTTGSLRDYVDRATAVRRFTVRLLAVFVGMAVLLAGLGVYAVSAYSVEQRRREIGLRLALGATPGGVVGLVLRRTLGAAGIAALIGTVGALAAGRLMTGLLYGVSHTDPAPLAAVIGLVVLTSAAAGWIPARRAARTDPLVAIHS
jgi:predicted permease